MTSGRNPAVILYDASGVAMAVANGVAIPVGTDALLIAGTDGANSRFATVKAPSTAAVAADPALVVSVSPNSVVLVQPVGATAATLPKLINLNYNKSDGAIVANTFKRVVTYTVPNGFIGMILKFISYQGETGSSRLVVETSMGQHNDNTNVFTAGSSYTTPTWAPVVEGDVTVAFAAGSGNVVVTLTYTNELGVAGRTGTITMSKGSAVGARAVMALQGTDLGVTSIQAASGTPTQVGTMRFLGLINLSLHEDQSTTTQTETFFAPGTISFAAGTVLGIEYNGGTVSKARLFDTLVQLQ
mgnify:CR=1 FL=1